MTAATPAERQRAYRARKAAAQLQEVRGIFAPPELHFVLKRSAEGQIQAWAHRLEEIARMSYIAETAEKFAKLTKAQKAKVSKQP